MRSDYNKFKISICGSTKEIEEAKQVLDELSLTGDESKDRLIIQEAIDSHKIKADILYDGNTVFSYERVIRDFKKALNSKPSPVTEYGNGDYNLTNYLYGFLSLRCGSIAHYNKYGWIGTYPSKDDLKQFCRCNEFGQNILDYQATWASDSQRIAKDILAMIR